VEGQGRLHNEELHSLYADVISSTCFAVRKLSLCLTKSHAMNTCR